MSVEKVEEFLKAIDNGASVETARIASGLSANEVEELKEEIEKVESERNKAFIEIIEKAAATNPNAVNWLSNHQKPKP